MTDRGEPTTRRQALRAAVNGSVALGISALSPIDDVLAAGDERQRITYAYARSDPEDPSTYARRTKTVPGDWHRAVAGAFRIHDALVEANVPGLLGSAVVPGSYDAPMASITVDVLPDAETVVRESIPDLLDSVGFVVNRVQDPESLSGGGESTDVEYAGSITPPGVPGGVLCGHPDGQATLAPALFDGDGRRFFTTSNHLYSEADAPEDDPLYVFPAEDTRIHVGDLEAGYPRQDFVRVRPTGEFRPSNRIQVPGPSVVAGQFTRLGLADLKARGKPLRKVGARTGFTEGQIRGVDGLTCYAGDLCRRGQLRWGNESTFDDGDSGSINFRPDPERPEDCLLVGGFNNARTWWPGQNFTWGTAAHQITAVHGYHF
jgi:hypothetical protein